MKFSNSNTGLICSKIFDDFREILVQVNKAVYDKTHKFHLDFLLEYKQAKNVDELKH